MSVFAVFQCMNEGLSFNAPWMQRNKDAYACGFRAIPRLVLALQEEKPKPGQDVFPHARSRILRHYAHPDRSAMQFDEVLEDDFVFRMHVTSIWLRLIEVFVKECCSPDSRLLVCVLH